MKSEVERGKERRGKCGEMGREKKKTEEKKGVGKCETYINKASMNKHLFC